MVEGSIALPKGVIPPEDIEHVPDVNITESRNVLGFGENGGQKQQLLYNSRVMVVGSDILAQMVLANLLGLGVRDLCCVSNESAQKKENSFLYTTTSDVRRAKLIADGLGRMHSFVRPCYYDSDLRAQFIREFKPEIVIDATNDSKSKEKALDYCAKIGTPFLSASSAERSSVLTAWNPNGNGNAGLERLTEVVHREFVEQRQGSYTSGVIAGLTVEQVRKFKFQIKEDNLDKPLETGRLLRYTPHTEFQTIPQSFRDLSVLVVGAGAVGNFVALNLALLGVGNIDIADGDKIEYTNLNRQLLLYGKVGCFKAEVLSERIQEINNTVKGNFYNFFLTKASDILQNGKERYDAVFSCVDNYRGRYLINEGAVRNQIVMIEGATSATSGSVLVYMPKKNRCLDCELDLTKLAQEEQEEEKQQKARNNSSCVRSPDPSVVMPNIIVGSEMVAELVNIISGNYRLLDKKFEYTTLWDDKILMEGRLAVRQCGRGCM